MNHPRLLRACAVGFVAVLSLSACSGEDKKTPPAPDVSFDVPCPGAFGAVDGAADKTLPKVTLPCLDEDSDDLAMQGAPGVPTVINMWASWCGPCQEEMPFLDTLSQNADGSVQVLGVASIDRRSAASSFAADFDLSFPSVFDLDGVVQKSTLVKTLPVSVFVDASGAVVHTERRAFTSYADLQAKVAKYLGVEVS